MSLAIAASPLGTNLPSLTITGLEFAMHCPRMNLHQGRTLQTLETGAWCLIKLPNVPMVPSAELSAVPHTVNLILNKLDFFLSRFVSVLSALNWMTLLFGERGVDVK